MNSKINLSSKLKNKSEEFYNFAMANCPVNNLSIESYDRDRLIFFGIHRIRINE